MAADETPSAPAASAPTGAPGQTSNGDGDSNRNGTASRRGNWPDRSRGGGRGAGRGRGGRGGGRGGGKDGGGEWKNKRTAGFGSNDKRDVGDRTDRREQIQNDRSTKRRKVIDEEVAGSSYMSIAFSPDEIAAEERRPKRKVAVLIGYAGTGYHGIQINHKEKTIEGDIFAAFVAAGAISKANADDPKKSSLVRCARTDKGVHAAGNVLSLKLIVEDEDVVEKINKHLPDQIRVWGIQRTNNAFSCYQSCDSRWYEYLMPSYALLPPQPRSFLGKKIIDSAKEMGVYDEFMGRIEDVTGFWEEVEKNDIQPIIDALDPAIKDEVLSLLHDHSEQVLADDPVPAKATEEVEAEDVKMDDAPTEKASEQSVITEETSAEVPAIEFAEAAAQDQPAKAPKPKPEPTPVELAVRAIKAAYIAAKRRYRTTPARLEKFQSALDLYLGTHNFHNYTILKSANDPSANRHIKSFEVQKTPIQIRDTEWLSIKIHGQSFMMHQIRKMIAMAVMVTRCGAPLDLIRQSYESRRISIPKAPGLGLTLERPMFTEYNKKAIGLGKEEIDFAKYEDQIQKFKDEHIYRRMFELEEKENSFHIFFNQVDNFKTDYFLWVTAGGVEASHERSDRAVEKVPTALQAELGDEADGVVEVGN
ncbi:pseudouridine synthase [Cercophora scortea]|uniref:tRNA pseudouridine synthase 1 n=1 Tax=Cercophora scortea TaxID=314031 RepID=A0AAE0MGF9_9PEZI|nr:pseudouridine synthase [Cercophora scortea]